MKCIVAADKKWGIGLKNKLLVHIPEDMKTFRNLTIGKVVILGRKTLETFPNGLPLQGRTNIIMSRNEDFTAKDAFIAHSEEELMEILKDYDTDDVFVIGGGKIYDMLMPYCDEAIVTRLNYRYEADTYFPDLDNDDDWYIADESEEMTYFSIEYQRVIYKRKSKKEF